MKVRLGELQCLPTPGQTLPQDYCHGFTRENQSRNTAVLVRDFINLSDNGTSFLCLIMIWNTGCDLWFLYDSLPPGSRSQRWCCCNLWCRLLRELQSIPGNVLFWAPGSPWFQSPFCSGEHCLPFSKMNTFLFINELSKKIYIWLFVFFFSIFLQNRLAQVSAPVPSGIDSYPVKHFIPGYEILREDKTAPVQLKYL